MGESRSNLVGVLMMSFQKGRSREGKRDEKKRREERKMGGRMEREQCDESKSEKKGVLIQTQVMDAK